MFCLYGWLALLAHHCTIQEEEEEEVNKVIDYTCWPVLAWLV
jgi:hypothetical protein